MTEMDKRAELERIKAASARLVQRAKQDPEVARAFLRDIGYYEMIEQTDPGNSHASLPTAKARPTAPRKSAARQTGSARRKKAAAKRNEATAKR